MRHKRRQPGRRVQGVLRPLLGPVFLRTIYAQSSKTHKIPARTRREANAETRIKPGFFEFQKRPEKGVKSATNQKVGGSSPSWRATSEQSPLCSDVFFCLRHKIPERPLRRDFPVPTSYPRSRSANSAKNRLGVCKTPILLRKTALLAAHPHPSLKIRSAPQRRDFPVQSGHGFSCPIRPRTKMPGCCRIRAFLFQQSGPGDRSPCFSARTSSRVQGWVL